MKLPEGFRALNPDALHLAGLSTTRAKDRGMMVEMLRALASAHSCGITVNGSLSYFGVTICHVRGLNVSTSIAAPVRRERADHFMAAWFIVPGLSLRIAPSFGGVNATHGQRATFTTQGFDALYPLLAEGLKRANDGSAFE